eukprot:TRINITY_DN25070_c0_g1_i2.p1 TRINITY_DN25070_c0_g1~~TRINITY_DN25070_c0_g1_i2.p1  ORF type:complete len:707 (-),score=162.99 TRINITY_DN25070_c0_g1_i2:143-2263(-)
MAFDANRALNKLTVAELKQLCKEQGLAGSGPKSDLIRRLVDHRERQVGEEPGTGTPASTQSVVSDPPAPVNSRGRGRARGRGGKQPAVKSSPSSTRAQGISGGTAGRGSFSQSRPVALLGAGLNSGNWAASRQQQLRCVRCEAQCDLGFARYTGKLEDFWCPVCRFKVMDPFNAVVEGRGVLRYMLVREPHFEFTLDLSELRQWKRDGKSVEVRMLRVDASKACQVWPRQLHFFANGAEVFAIQPPEEGHKRRDVPMNATPGLKGAQNAIRVRMVDDDCSGFAMAVLLTAPQSIPTLTAQVQRCDEVIARQRICELLSKQAAKNYAAAGDGDGEDIVCLTSDKLSLKCPITMDRVKDPVRGQHCQHMQCFSREAYMMSNRQMGAFNKRWVCPLCTLVVRPSDLCFDSYVSKVIALTSEDVEEVAVSSDGSWRSNRLVADVLSDDEDAPLLAPGDVKSQAPSRPAMDEPLDLDAMSPSPKVRHATPAPGLQDLPDLQLPARPAGIAQEVLSPSVSNCSTPTEGVQQSTPPATAKVQAAEPNKPNAGSDTATASEGSSIRNGTRSRKIIIMGADPAASAEASPAASTPKGFELAVAAMSVVGGAFSSPSKSNGVASALATTTAAARQRRLAQLELEDDDASPSVKAAPAKRRFAAAVDGASKHARKVAPSATAEQAATPARSTAAVPAVESAAIASAELASRTQIDLD